MMMCIFIAAFLTELVHLLYINLEKKSAEL